MKHYILDDDGMPSPVDLLSWAQWMQNANRRIAFDQFGDVDVSTVFLGMDHAYLGGPPVLWETMVFGGPMDQHTERYTDPDAAMEGHARIVKQVQEALTTEP